MAPNPGSPHPHPSQRGLLREVHASEEVSGGCANFAHRREREEEENVETPQCSSRARPQKAKMQETSPSITNPFIIN